MIAAIALAAAFQATAIDWEALAPLPYRAPPIVTRDMHAFAVRQAVARKCPMPAPARGQPRAITIHVAVLVDEAGGIRVAVPRAARCPTVEQYAAALVASFARNNLLPRMSVGEQWYRTSLSFIQPR